MAASDESAQRASASDADIGEELRRIKVSDLVAQAVSGLVSLGCVRLSEEQRDLAQARLAIDSLRALEPVVREQVSVEMAADLEQAIASLQLGFAEVALAPAPASRVPESTGSSETSAQDEAGSSDAES